MCPTSTALWQTPAMSAAGGEDQVFVLRATVRELVIYLAFLAVFSIGVLPQPLHAATMQFAAQSIT